MAAEPTPHQNSTQQTQATNKDWTIMLFIAADGTLANFAVESLKLLNKSVKENDPVKVAVGTQFAFHTGATVTTERTVGQTPQHQPEAANEKIHHIQLGREKGKDPDPNNTIRRVLALADKKTTKKPQKEALKGFLESVATDQNLVAKHYALILWGHGPELLFEPADSNSNRMFITPQDLREVLDDWKRAKVAKDEKGTLDIVGFDACFMSMFEMAYEIRDYADYMVASQDEVPDASFPYDKLLQFFSTGDNTEELLKKGVDDYIKTYGGYIFGQSTGLNPVTLSALRLGSSAGAEGSSADPKPCDKLKTAVDAVATALLNVPKSMDVTKRKEFYDRLIAARQESRDYADGLYVDLSDFCEKLKASKVKGIEKQCDDVLTALANLILEKDSAREDKGLSHGISIYLPYLIYEENNRVNRPLVKGGKLTGKGFSDVLNGAALEYLRCARRDLILQTESYYPGLQLASAGTSESTWYDFIADLWTKVLIETAPADLDYHYSAQQAWMNVCRKSIDLS